MLSFSRYLELLQASVEDTSLKKQLCSANDNVKTILESDKMFSCWVNVICFHEKNMYSYHLSWCFSLLTITKDVDCLSSFGS